MAVDIATLGIRIDSSDARTAARDMENFRGAGARAEQQVTALDVVSRKAAQALQLLGVGAGVGAIIRMADEYTKYNAQLKLATQSQREYLQAVEDVRNIAKAAQQDLAATGTLYARISTGTRELGVEQKRVAAITETVNLALKVSGATAAESASAQLQLSQAFASGTLRGEEFNAVNEAAPRLMKALADGIGVPIGALKDMASNGEITSKVMAQVLPQALEQLRDEAKQVQTIAGAFTVLKNNVLEFTGTQAQANGTVSLLAGGITLLAENLNVLMGVVATVTAVKFANSFTEWATGAYQSVVANRALAAANLSTAESNVAATGAALATARARETELRASVLAAEGVVALAIAENGLIPAQARSAAAAQAHTAALAAQAAAASAASVGMGVLRGALAFLGGPIGAVVTVLGVAATAWSWYSSKSAEANTKTAEDTKASTAEVVAQMTKQIEVMERRNKMALAGVPTTSKQSPLDDKLAEIVAQIDQVGKAEGDYAKLSYEARGEVLKVLGGQYAEVTALIERFNKATADGAGNTELSKRLTEIRERAAGVSSQYQKDLKTFQEALALGVDKGGMSIEEYTRNVTALAQETWKGSEAGKAAIATTSKSAEAYKTLISSIHEATATNKLELAAGIDATDAQKARIKLDQELLSGKVKLEPKQLAAIRAALDEQEASEKLLKSQRGVASAIAELNEQRRQDFATAAADAAANEQAAATFGMTKAQIEALTVARMQDRLAHAADLELGADEVALLLKLIPLRQRSADALTKTDALGYIKQLTDENKRFAADSIIDERARAAALLEIDAEVWRKRIALAGAGTEQQKQLQEQFDIWYRDQSIKPMLDEQREAVKKYDDVFREGFADMLNHGKSGWKSFTTSLVTTFKTTVADQIYKMLAQPFVVKMVGSLLGVTGTGAAAAQSAAGSVGGSAATSMLGTAAGSLFGAGGLSGSLMAGAGWLTGATTLSGSLAAGASLIGTGTLGGIASGMGMMVGALGPIALGVGAVLALTKKWDTSGTIHTGGAASASASGVSNIDATTLGLQHINTADSANQLTSQLATSIVKILDSTATTFGKNAGYTAATAFADDTSKDGAWGALIISNLNGIVSQWGDANSRWAPKVFADGEAGQKEYLASIGTSVRDALNSIGLPAWAKSMLDDLGNAPALEDLAKVVDTINATQAALVTMGQRLVGFSGLSDAATTALIKAAGGINTLAANASSYYDAFYTDAEKTAVVTDQVTAALKAVGLQMPTTRDGYRALVEQQLALGESGTTAVAALLANASAFANVVPAATATTEALNQQQQAAADLANTNADYQAKIDKLLAARQGEAAVRALEIAGMDASTVALYDRLKALEAEDAAMAAASAAIKAAQESAAAAVQSLGNSLVDSMKQAEAAAKAFRALNDSLLIGDSSVLNPEQKYLEAKRQFETADSSNLQAAEKAFLDASKAWFGGSAGYAVDFQAVLARNQAEAAAQDAAVQGIINFWRNYNGIDGSHRDGLERVPFDGYVAELHRDERVQTASQVRDGDAAAQRANELLAEVVAQLGADKVQRGAAANAQISETRALRAEVASLKRKIAVLEKQ